MTNTDNNNPTIPGKAVAVRKAPPMAWKPGQSGNPGGRPKSLRALVLDATNDGKDIIAFMVQLLRDDTEAIGKPISLQLRYDAAGWLADRGFGKVIASAVEDTGAAPKLLDLTALSPAELDNLESLVSKGTALDSASPVEGQQPDQPIPDNIGDN